MDKLTKEQDLVTRYNKLIDTMEWAGCSVVFTMFPITWDRDGYEHIMQQLTKRCEYLEKQQ